MRSEVVPSAAVTDPKAFEEKVTLAKEIAVVLKKNVVQARRVESAEPDQEKWSASRGVISRRCASHRFVGIKITEHTELGSNESIKAPPPVEESSRSARKRAT